MVSSSASDLAEMEACAMRFAEASRPVFFIYTQTSVPSSILLRLRALDGYQGLVSVENLEAKTEASSQTAGPRKTHSLLPKFITWIFHPLLRKFIIAIGHHLAVLHLYIWWRKYFARVVVHRNPAFIVTPEMVVGYVWPNLLKAAKSAAVPLVVVPFTLANEEEVIRSTSEDRRFSPGLLWRLGLIPKKWLYFETKVALQRLPSAHILAHEILGISLPNPWVITSGADFVFVDSLASKDYFSRSGTPVEKIFVVGSSSIAETGCEIKNNLVNSRARGKGSEFTLLISGCPNQLAGQVPACEFSSMGEIAEHLIQELAVVKGIYDVTLCPHPNYMEFGNLMLCDWLFVENARPVSELIDEADLFLAFASSTIRWALARGIPVINYDIFNYSYADYSNVSSVITVSSADEFSSILSRLRTDERFINELKNKAKDNAEYWRAPSGRFVNLVDAAIRARGYQI